MTGNASLMRLLTCLVVAVIYVWQEQQEFLFSPVHFPVFILGIGILSIALFHFQRAAAASNGQFRLPARCASSGTTLWKSMPYSLPAPN